MSRSLTQTDLWNLQSLKKCSLLSSKAKAKLSWFSTNCGHASVSSMTLLRTSRALKIILMRQKLREFPNWPASSIYSTTTQCESAKSNTRMTQMNWLMSWTVACLAHWTIREKWSCQSPNQSLRKNVSFTTCFSSSLIRLESGSKTSMRASGF